MIRNTCGKFQLNISSGYLENKPLHANFNLRCDADADADAGGSTIALLIYKYIVELMSYVFVDYFSCLEELLCLVSV